METIAVLEIDFSIHVMIQMKHKKKNQFPKTRIQMTIIKAAEEEEEKKCITLKMSFHCSLCRCLLLKFMFLLSIVEKDDFN